MRKVKDPNLAQLLMQLRFAPEKKRLEQLDCAERLFAVIDRKKEYPFEFVCFRITGYHPKGLGELPLIKGEELLEDLRVFISKLSAQVAQPVVHVKQKVYTVEELAAACGVSTKTIHRWRKRGLPARKFVFAGGKKRFGFLQSTVDKFFEDNPELVSKAKGFRRLTAKEKQQIVRQAAVLAAKTTMSRYQIMEQVSAKTGKAHETVRYTLFNYERAHPDKRIFSRPWGVVSQATAAEIYKLFKQGCAVEELMRRFSRNRSSIYRLINLRRARALLGEKIEFIASDEFIEAGAKEKILSRPIDIDKPALRKNGKPMQLAGESFLPEYLQRLKNTPVLNRERERELFRRYNYLKYLACTIRAGVKAYRPQGRRLKEIEDYLSEAETIKNMIIEANLRLVVSIANKHTTSGANLVDLVSEGNFSLMRAAEKFDYARGFRFATYASWAITKNYARKIPAETARPDKAAAGLLANVQRDMRTTAAADFAAVERERQSLVQVIADELDEREQYIILNHFGLVGSPLRKKSKTLKQIGEDLSLTKERVRQIELIALQKLRQSVSAEEFELLTG